MSKQFGLRSLMFAVLFFAVAALSIRLGIDRTRRNIETSRSTYAARLVAQMCVEHMKANGQEWPTNWDQLRDDFEPCLKRSGQSWTFEDLQRRVGVDWEVDPLQFQLDDESSRLNAENQVIWVASEPEQKFYGTSPNQIVSKYLKRKSVSGL